jgi:hypothetical protein
VTVNLDRFRREGILEGKLATASVEARDGGDTVVNARQSEVGPGILVCLTSDGYDRGAEAAACGALGHISAVDVELIGRCEIVECGIPLRARVGLVR